MKSCYYKLEATFEGNDNTSIKLVTLENPFPKISAWWKLHPKKTAKVAVIEFLMLDEYDAEGGGISLALFQEKSELHIISFHI